jgi:hypothetical protein
MLIGYARVSTDDQNLDLQRDAPTVRIRVLLSHSRLTEWLMVGDEEAAITPEPVCHKGVVLGFAKTAMFS